MGRPNNEILILAEENAWMGWDLLGIKCVCTRPNKDNAKETRYYIGAV